MLLASLLAPVKRDSANAAANSNARGDMSPTQPTAPSSTRRVALRASTLEMALRSGWPASHDVEQHGWALRVGDGYSKRANSVWPLAGEASDSTQQPDAVRAARIEAAEARYAAAGLPCVFRLTDAVPTPQLEAALAARHYLLADPTQVLTRELTDTTDTTNTAAPANFKLLSAPQWTAEHARLAGLSARDARRHAALLGRMLRPPIFGAITRHSDQRPQRIVAVGLAVITADCVGVFSVVTDPTARRAGHGRALMTGLIHEAGRHGGRIMYLGVLDQNQAARRLYDALGFAPAYRYWYRVAP